MCCKDVDSKYNDHNVELQVAPADVTDAVAITRQVMVSVYNLDLEMTLLGDLPVEEELTR